MVSSEIHKRVDELCVIRRSPIHRMSEKNDIGRPQKETTTQLERKKKKERKNKIETKRGQVVSDTNPLKYLIYR